MALNSYSQIKSAPRYDLRESTVHVEVPVTASGDAGETFLIAGISDQTQLSIIKSGSNLLFRSTVNGDVRDFDTIPYDPRVERWWRIRVSGPFIAWETSEDGNDWVTRRVSIIWMPLGQLYVQLRAGTWDPSETPGVAAFDNLNLPPGS